MSAPTITTVEQSARRFRASLPPEKAAIVIPRPILDNPNLSKSQPRSSAQVPSDAQRDDRRATSLLDLEEPLLELADLASHTVPGNDGAGVTRLQDGSPVYRSSNGFARAVDRMQYRIGEGPCIDAVDQGCTVVSGTIGAGDQRWPKFTREAQSLEVRSVLSLSMTVADRVIGSVNVYSRRPDAFDDEAIAIGEQFAGPAASSLSTSHLVVQTLDAADFASYALAERATIETAVGVLIGLNRLSAAAARRRLVAMADESGVTLETAAEHVLAELARRPPRRP